MRNRHPPEQLKFLIYTIVPPRHVIRVRVGKFKTKVGLVEILGLVNFQLPKSTIGGDMGG